MQTTPIHYDCDPGQDDAIALLYALGSETIDVKSISVVGGNANVLQCAKNALQILELAGKVDVPVYVGAGKPLKRGLKTLPEVFGETGMAGAEDLPEPKAKPRDIDWTKGLSSISREKTIVATGPLTNLALEIQRNPSFAESIDQLYIMGGCAYPEPLRGWMGNYKAPGASDYAEYNFAVDPEAAKIVFRAGFKKIKLMGVNITRMVLYNQDIDTALRKIGSKVALKVADILATIGEDDIQDYGHIRKSPHDPVRAIHDVVAMAMLDAPEIFSFKEVPLRIVDTPLPAPGGQSIIDVDNYDHPAVEVATTIDNEAFIAIFLKNMGRVGNV